MKDIAAETSKYNSVVTDCADSASLSALEISVSRPFDNDIEQNIMQQVAATNNPFLNKAFEMFISTEDQVDTTLHKISIAKEEKSNTEFIKNVNVILPWPKILEIVVTRVLNSKFSGAGKLVRDILMREYKLEKELKLMRSVYMMEHHIMSKFCNFFFHEVRLEPAMLHSQIA